MQKRKDTVINVPILELEFMLNTVETLEAEVEQLEYDNDWYSSDSIDMLTASKQILCRLLGKETDPDEDTEDQ
jgi:hypothetical protein